MSSALDLVDLEKVDARLKQDIDDLTGTPEIRVLAGGSSNLTYALDYPDRTLVIRRAPPGTKARGAHDMLREAKILAGLAPQFGAVPQVFSQVDDPDVMDTPFYVMSFVDGLILRGNATSEEIGGVDGADRLCEAFVATLVDLHAVDVTVPELSWLNRGEGYVARQIGGWSKRYRNARTPDAPDCEAVMAWLDDRQPADAGSCLIHGDYRLDNMVLGRDDRARILGVLDWELATVGCPLMDLGSTLAYWVQADDDPTFGKLGLQPTHLPGFWTRDQLVARYEALSGRKVEDLVFYLVYGLFRLAGIAQQIYYRHYHGQFTSDHFARFGPTVHYLDQRCRSLIEGADHG